MLRAVWGGLTSGRLEHGFTVGILDDVCHTSVEFDADLDIEPDDVKRAVFYGLGSDGTVGANKNSIKIIGGSTDRHVEENGGCPISQDLGPRL